MTALEEFWWPCSPRLCWPGSILSTSTAVSPRLNRSSIPSVDIAFAFGFFYGTYPHHVTFYCIRFNECLLECYNCDGIPSLFPSHLLTRLIVSYDYVINWLGYVNLKRANKRRSRAAVVFAYLGRKEIDRGVKDRTHLLGACSSGSRLLCPIMQKSIQFISVPYLIASRANQSLIYWVTVKRTSLKGKSWSVQ